MPNTPLLNAWKAGAKVRLERLQKVLSATLPPGQAYRRSVLLNHALNSVNKQKDWIEAYDQHLEKVREALDGAATTSASATKSKMGNLGE